MPRTGWCRECGDWVDVQDDESCPNGHGPESVDAVHVDRGAERAVDGSVGVGEMPTSFERFSWGAYFLMPFWGIAYGSTMVLGWWALSFATPLLIGSVFAGATNPAAAAASSSLSSVVQIGIHLWVGMNAYRWLWRKERLRLQVLPDATPEYRASDFLARQVRWLIAGAVYTVISLLGLAFLGLSTEASAVTARERLGITPNEVMIVAFWTLAQVGLAVRLASRMRSGKAIASESA